MPHRANPRGCLAIPLTVLIADAIAVHGLQWAVSHYAKHLTPFEVRVLFRGAFIREHTS